MSHSLWFMKAQRDALIWEGNCHHCLLSPIKTGSETHTHTLLRLRRSWLLSYAPQATYFTQFGRFPRALFADHPSVTFLKENTQSIKTKSSLTSELN